jgi:hypothetical protein
VAVLLILLLSGREFSGETPAYKCVSFWERYVEAGLFGNQCAENARALANKAKAFATTLRDRGYLEDLLEGDPTLYDFFRGNRVDSDAFERARQDFCSRHRHLIPRAFLRDNTQNEVHYRSSSSDVNY